MSYTGMHKLGMLLHASNKKKFNRNLKKQRAIFPHIRSPEVGGWFISLMKPGPLVLCWHLCFFLSLSLMVASSLLQLRIQSGKGEEVIPGPGDIVPFVKTEALFSLLAVLLLPASHWPDYVSLPKRGWESQHQLFQPHWRRKGRDGKRVLEKLQQYKPKEGKIRVGIASQMTWIPGGPLQRG